MCTIIIVRALFNYCLARSLASGFMSGKITLELDRTRSEVRFLRSVGRSCCYLIIGFIFAGCFAANFGDHYYNFVLEYFVKLFSICS